MTASHGNEAAMGPDQDRAAPQRQVRNPRNFDSPIAARQKPEQRSAQRIDPATVHAEVVEFRLGRRKAGQCATGFRQGRNARPERRKGRVRA